MMIFLIFLLLFNPSINRSGAYFHSPDDTSDIKIKQCFCELKGTIDDCSCNVDTVDFYNNVKIYPRLKSLLTNNYFRFYKTNLHNECPFWKDVEFQCAMKFCHVKPCKEQDIPLGLKGEEPHLKYIKETQTIDCSEDLNKELGFLNKSISEKVHKELKRWSEHDDAQDNFCILDDHHEGAEYVDLLLNPERFTGYQGKSAHRIWETIYLENCFKLQDSKSRSSFTSLIDSHSLRDVCLEERVFYRMVSGLHTSINIHLCANYLQPEKNSLEFASPNGVWGPNLKEFKRRFSPETTEGQGDHWLRNLYFAYIVELRAIAKVAQLLRNEEYYTGFDNEDKEVQLAVNDLLNVIESFPSHFDESIMFSGDSSKMKFEFREKFLNISRIMDCVGCDKCRLWGKLQTQGMGTALKILFSGKFEYDVDRSGFYVINGTKKQQFKLQRTEIVSLFNAFGRLSNSIHSLELFRNQLR
ncbi:CLUMA_CG014418, isoform A [Clunio marinus]|uniref:CLUMA_CG014418, isoform A n=1 Tax=Clunio marinus TaxID=568069 RepID=A0A1J1IR01_9DIPT|nr:CLUMA_CG014418, isoform A [Clunio marinus]